MSLFCHGGHKISLGIDPVIKGVSSLKSPLRIRPKPILATQTSGSPICSYGNKHIYYALLCAQALPGGNPP